MRVLITRLSHLGDIILTEPVIRSIRAAHSDAKIDFLTRERYRDAVQLLGGVESILTLEIPGQDESLTALTRTVRNICKPKYDMLIDLHSNLRSWWIRLHLKADIKRTYPKNWLARRRAVIRKIHSVGLHTVDLYLSALGGTGIPAADRIPTISTPQRNRDRLLENHALTRGEYCVFAVGASHPTKHYPITQWVELAEALIRRIGMNVVVVEEEHFGYLNLFDSIRDSGRLHILTGLRLPDIAALLASARFTVSNDSGIMHLSAATGRPTIGLFGPTHPSLGFSPLGRACRAITTDEKCSPCSRHGASPCYRDDRYCFTNMSTDIIVKHIGEVLNRESAEA